MSEPTINRALLLRVRDHILEEPRRVNIGTWVEHRTQKAGGPACETVGCIAGWTVLLAHQTDGVLPEVGYFPDQQWEYQRVVRVGGAWQRPDLLAPELLGLTEAQALWLFDEEGIFTRPRTLAHAEDVALRIDRFLAADGDVSQLPRHRFEDESWDDDDA